jgi:hypothetical protein
MVTYYEGESVNRSQIDIKRKTRDIRNPQRRSLLTVVSATSAPGPPSSATFERPWENFLTEL